MRHEVHLPSHQGHFRWQGLLHGDSSPPQSFAGHARPAPSETVSSLKSEPGLLHSDPSIRCLRSLGAKPSDIQPVRASPSSGSWTCPFQGCCQDDASCS